MASASGRDDVDAGRLLMYLIGKSLMVDEASTGLQHAEAVLGKGCAGKAGPQLPGYRSDSSTVTANCGVSTPAPSQVLVLLCWVVCEL